MDSRENQQEIMNSNEDAISNIDLNSGSENEVTFLLDQINQEFNKSYGLNSLPASLLLFSSSSPSMESGQNILPDDQHTKDDKQCDKGSEAKKRCFKEMEIDEEEQIRRTLDLNLHLGLHLQKENLSSNQSDISSTISSLHEEVDEFSNKTLEVPSLVLMGCSHCLIYVMVSEIDPKCPNCNTSTLIDMFRNNCKKSRKT